ncbi:MAG: hypothetical protein HWN81_18205 [Candidatus Lokiarchaeota archaeon]|nr:hypothetical protein [Candidatus Lokiarchaeota archaeon]
MVWSKLQKTDKVMCTVALIGGIVALIESIFHLINIFEIWSLGIEFEIAAVVLAIIVILLGFKPIHYTPAILIIICIFLIIFASVIGGGIILIAGFIGVLS